MIAVKAHFDGKVIVPDEPLKLPKGKPLRVHVEILRPTPKKPKNAKKKQSLLDWVVKHRVTDDSLPVDLSYQHDHYLYGTPKKKPPKRKPPRKKLS